MFYILYIKIQTYFINIADQFALNAALARQDIKYFVNHYLIFQLVYFSVKIFIYDTAITVNCVLKIL